LAILGFSLIMTAYVKQKSGAPIKRLHRTKAERGVHRKAFFDENSPFGQRRCATYCAVLAPRANRRRQTLSSSTQQQLQRIAGSAGAQQVEPEPGPSGDGPGEGRNIEGRRSLPSSTPPKTAPTAQATGRAPLPVDCGT